MKVKALGLFALTLVVLLAIAQSSFALTKVTAKVVYVGTYGNGDFYVMTDTAINEPGCTFPHGVNRFDVPANHPQAKNWLAIALMALSTGKSVMLRTNGCFEGSPTMDDSRDTFFLILDQ